MQELSFKALFLSDVQAPRGRGGPVQVLGQALPAARWVPGRPQARFPGLQQAEGDQVVGPDDAGPELQLDRGEGGQRMGRASGKHLNLYPEYFI